MSEHEQRRENEDKVRNFSTSCLGLSTCSNNEVFFDTVLMEHESSLIVTSVIQLASDGVTYNTIDTTPYDTLTKALQAQIAAPYP